MISKIKNTFKSYNPILRSEFKKTFPIYSLGILVNGLQATFHFTIPFIIGKILDLVLQGAISKEIMEEVYLLIFVSVLSLIPRVIYRILFFTRARISDVKLRKTTIEYLQYVKPEYYEREDKGTFLEYISKELLIIRKFLGDFFFNLGRLFLNSTTVLIIIAIKYNMLISISVFPILVVISIFIFRMYKELNDKIEESRIADINLFKIAEQNTSRIFSYKAI